MAIQTRYFSTTGAGAADGTTWADRAALFSAGNWSTVITGFAFNGSDSMRAFIGPGTYTCSQSLASGLFANPPTIANPLVFVGCDASGALLSIPDPDWTSDQPAWSDTTLPAIGSASNVIIINLINTFCLLLKFSSSARAGAVISAAGHLDWCIVENSHANSASVATTVSNATNCVFRCTGSSYSSAWAGATYGQNCRLEGVAGSSGNRNGFEGVATSGFLVRCTIAGHGGHGVAITSSNTSQSYRFSRCTIVGNAGTGILPNSTASQLAHYSVQNCLITGNGAFGIDAQSAARLLASNNRLRDNTSGNFSGLGNYPTDLNNFTTDSDDATEYVNAAGGDYRIKSGSAIHGQGYGVSDEPSSGSSGGGPLLNGRLIQ